MDQEARDRSSSFRARKALAKRLCITLHLIGPIRKDLGWKASFREFDPLSLEWGILVGPWVEALIPVVEGHGQEKPVVAPCLDRPLVDLEFFGDFLKCQHAGFPQPLVASLEIVGAPDLLDHSGAEPFTGS